MNVGDVIVTFCSFFFLLSALSLVFGSLTVRVLAAMTKEGWVRSLTPVIFVAWAWLGFLILVLWPRIVEISLRPP